MLKYDIQCEMECGNKSENRWQKIFMLFLQLGHFKFMSLFVFQYPSRHWTSKDANRIIYYPIHVITRDTLLPPARSKYSKIKFKRSSIRTPQGSRRIPTECSWIWMRKWSSSESRSQQKIVVELLKWLHGSSIFAKEESGIKIFPWRYIYHVRFSSRRAVISINIQSIEYPSPSTRIFCFSGQFGEKKYEPNLTYIILGTVPFQSMSSVA